MLPTSVNDFSLDIISKRTRFDCKLPKFNNELGLRIYNEIYIRIRTYTGNEIVDAVVPCGYIINNESAVLNTFTYVTWITFFTKQTICLYKIQFRK